MNTLLRRGLATALLLLASMAAHAGRPCEARLPDVDAVSKAFALAERTAAALDATGARVVVIGRAGQDLRRYGLRWSHLGFAYRDEDAPGRPWRIVHKLNQCASARADLYRQGLAEFFLDDLFRYEAAIAVPAADAQARLVQVLADDERVARLHIAAYSMLAYPWSQRYQQSNQWAIETLAMAIDDNAQSRGRAQAWLKLKGYEPTVLKIGALTRLGARIGSANIAFDDHPDELRYSDHIETVTVDSVFAWLERAKLADPVQVLR